VSERTRLVRTIVAIGGLLALAGACGWLAAWQFRRAAESREVSARFEAAAAAAALDVAPDALTEGSRFQPLTLRGRYVAEPQVLLDGRVHDDAAGYEVLTALELADGRNVLVDRGWVRADPDRSVLPDVSVEGDEREVRGRLERLPRAGIKLGAGRVVAPPEGPVIVALYPTAADIGHWLHSPVEDYMLLLDADANDGYVRDWQAPVMSPERHLAYAGQWILFGLGSIAAAVAVARSARASPTAEEPAP
jgi:cytochrome oxidase assembly protein ShyY1